MTKKTIKQLYSIDAYAFNKIGAKSGGEIRDNEDMLTRYQAIVISKLGEPDVQYNREIYDTLEDNNYHLLNETLIKYGYYGMALKELYKLKQVGVTMDRKQFDNIIESICSGYYWQDQGYKPIHDKFAIDGKNKIESLWRYIQKLQKKVGK